MTDAPRLAVSNIAWNVRDDEAVAALLRGLSVSGIEIAPTKWHPDPTATSPAERAAYRRSWEDRGLPIVAMQALLFGQPQLELFGDADSRRALADYLRRIIELGASLSATALVFGSPKNRLRHGLAMPSAMAIAADFFAALGDDAHEQGTTLCVEANPSAYGGDFIMTTAESVELCQRVNSPGLRVNVDLGGIAMSGDDPAVAIGEAASWIGHVHASEPQLAALGAADDTPSADDSVTRADHVRAGAALRSMHYAGWVSVEMRAVEGAGSLAAIERAVLAARNAYRG